MTEINTIENFWKLWIGDGEAVSLFRDPYDKAVIVLRVAVRMPDGRRLVKFFPLDSAHLAEIREKTPPDPEPSK